MKRALAALCIAFLFMLFGAALAEENLLPNGGFEEVHSDLTPSGWYATAYRNQSGYSIMTATQSKAHSGLYSVLVENASSNDARFVCTVKVKPSTMYRLSGYVLVEHMEDVGNGANFGIEDIYSFSDGVFDTDGQWRLMEWYGETGPDQKEVTIGVRVGGYSAESIGKAYFDDLSLVEIDELPQDVIASMWYRDDSGSGFAEHSSASAKTSSKKTWLSLISAVLFAAFYLFVRSRLEKDSSPVSRWVFPVVTGIAFLIRIILAVFVPGYEVDINCFTAWSLRMADCGPVGFYSPDYFCDYPPGMLLLLWPVGLLMQVIGTNHPLSLLVVKGLPVLFDILVAAVLFSFSKKRLGHKMAVWLSVLYLFNPAVLINGSAWGQVDSVLALLVLLTAMAAMDNQWNYAVPLFVVAALVKPQALLFAPVGGMWLILQLLSAPREKKMRLIRKTGIGFLWALAAASLIVIPFSVRQPNPFWLFELYGQTLSSYAYATVNAANLYYLFGANWAGLDTTVPTMLPLLTGALLLGAAGWIVCRGTGRHGWKVAAFSIAAAGVFCIVSTFLHLSYKWFGYGMMAFVYLYACCCLLKDRSKANLFYCMGQALCGIYVLGVKVHERYLFPALLLLLASYALSKDRRVLLIAVGFSATTFLNTAIVLENSILFGAAQGHLNMDTLWLNRILCVANLLLCGYAGWIGFDGLCESPAILKRIKQPQEESNTSGYERLLLTARSAKLSLKPADYLMMAAVSFVYGVVAFSNLGSMEAPQTAWVSTSAEETIVLELEQPSEFSVLYYAGVSYQDFAISVSDDGENWSDPVPCEMREGLCYRWLYAVESNQTDDGKTSFSDQKPQNVRWLKGKYLRVHAMNAGLNLWEIVARDRNGENLPLRFKEQTGHKADWTIRDSSAEHLVDERETCTGEPGWFNGMYFDEIYHARTAYEHLHGERPYETTHPPLGKLMMAVGISIFGMTPFGWRFAGTLIGVLMLPALYLFALQLTRKRMVATVSMTAFALDLMHYAQTRIATIDSFPVFFIMLSYLFMVRYMQSDFFDGTQLRLMSRSYCKSLVSLLLSGICMGLSIASKWIGLYSAVGLAVLFFLTVYRQYRVSAIACEMEAAYTGNDEAEKRIHTAQTFTLPRIALTCAFCILFFILVPCFIYYLSYIPYLAPSGPVTLQRIIDAQEGMLQYHSTPGLGMDHPFQSPWWQWPLILKPMWFAQDQFEPAGFASTIMCLGNPWVFYAGAFSMVILLCCLIVKLFRTNNGGLSVRKWTGGETLTVIAIGFFAQYLPWVLVPRSMYIYHYFASVPFVIMATAWVLDRIPDEKKAIRTIAVIVYLMGALVFFVMFFPYASGWLTPVEWLDGMKWFSHLYY